MSSSASAPRSETRRAGAAGSARKQRDDGTWANFYGGPRRPVDDRRGLRGAAARRRPGRRRAHAARARVHPRRGRRRADPRVHPHLVRAVRPVVVGRGAGDAARDRSSCRRGSRSTSTTSPAGRGRRSWRSTVVAAVGPCARRGSRSTSCAPARRRAVSRRRSWGPVRSRRLDRLLHRYERRPSSALRRARAVDGRALDRRPPGGRRLLGRHPAAVGLLADGAAPARLPARPPA